MQVTLNNDINLTDKELEVYKQIINLSPNESPKLQGDGVLKIAPFDNYYLITIYSELEKEDIPVDLTNMGDLYINFQDDKNEISIKNFTETKDIQPENGQVLFRITKENAIKILGLKNNVFYITSYMDGEHNGSDETVIYSGKVYEYNKGSVLSLEDEIEFWKLLYAKDIAAKNEEIESLELKIKTLGDQLASAEALVNAYKETNQQLQDQVDNLSSENVNNVDSQESLNNAIQAHEQFRKDNGKLDKFSEDNEKLLENEMSRRQVYLPVSRGGLTPVSSVTSDNPNQQGTQPGNALLPTFKLYVTHFATTKDEVDTVYKYSRLKTLNKFDGRNTISTGLQSTKTQVPYNYVSMVCIYDILDGVGSGFSVDNIKSVTIKKIDNQQLNEVYRVNEYNDLVLYSNNNTIKETSNSSDNAIKSQTNLGAFEYTFKSGVTIYSHESKVKSAMNILKTINSDYNPDNLKYNDFVESLSKSIGDLDNNIDGNKLKIVDNTETNEVTNYICAFPIFHLYKQEYTQDGERIYDGKSEKIIVTITNSENISNSIEVSVNNIAVDLY